MTIEEQIEEGYRLLHEDDIDHALDVSRQIQKEKPDAPEGFALEAEVMQKLNQWDPSIKALNKALALDPESARLYNLRGYAYLQKEALKEAREDIERAISLQDLAVAHRNLVLCMFLEEKGGEALQYLIGRIKQNPSDVENWILMGDIMKKGGDHDKARTYYEQVLKMDPDNEYAQKQLEE